MYYKNKDLSTEIKILFIFFSIRNNYIKLLYKFHIILSDYYEYCEDDSE